ncbi:bifunctional DedA family/phosphatase PAP2 family protein [Tabrizicola sp. YIM 78059]|uniref:bifunctional DedA family/phosphatase PAP2 family protein n=1 Tax=Tabrizicola sp. YIM 78059 TaxID=2529861 RepID=UPI0010AA756D|nr:bifunctional DedA family/phosphatase PAP2 family protein [Tabrizicola sp. YIM 78059]
MNQIAPAFVAFIEQHANLAALIVFLLAASESIVVVGALIPGTAILLGLSAMIGLGHLPLWPVLIGATLGAIAGDALSWWVGHHWRDRIGVIWPFSRYPRLITDGQRFFNRHGGKSILIARFTPGVRAIVPVVAGASGMPAGRFFAANIGSALIWAPSHVLPGALAGMGLGLAGHVSARLLLLVLGLILTVFLALLLLRLVLRWVLPRADGLRALVAQRLRSRPPAPWRRAALAVLSPDDDLRPLILLGLPLLMVAMALAGLAEEVAEHAGLARADAALSRAVTSLRTAPGNEAMTLVTNLGDAPVIITATVAAVLWLIIRRRWHLATGVALTMGLSTAFATAMKLTFAIPRPTALYDGAQVFGFPSGHATGAATLFGLLIWFAWRGLPQRWGGRLAGLLAVLVALIAASRIYLAAHWPSDVAGGLLLGAGLTLVFALAFRRTDPTPVARGTLAATLAVFAGFGGWHAMTNLPAALRIYAPVSPPLEIMTMADWLAGGWTALPARRTDLAGETEEVFTLQWAGNLADLQNLLLGQGWHAPQPLSVALGAVLSPAAPSEALPVLPRLDDGAYPVLTLILPAADGASRSVLRLYASGHAVEGVGPPRPILLGTLEHERLIHPFGLLTLSIAEDGPSPTLAMPDPNLRTVTAGDRTQLLGPV